MVACAASGVTHVPPTRGEEGALGVDRLAARRDARARGRAARPPGRAATRAPARPGRSPARTRAGRTARRAAASMPETMQARGGEHDRVDLAALELGKARVDVAAQVHHRESRPQGAQQGGAAQAAGADARAARQLARARPAGASPRRRAGPRAAAPRRSTKPGASSPGRSFIECTAQSMRPSPERALHLLDEQSLAAELASGTSRMRSPAVLMTTSSPRRPGCAASRRCRTHSRLRQGEAAAARTDAQDGAHDSSGVLDVEQAPRGVDVERLAAAVVLLEAGDRGVQDLVHDRLGQRIERLALARAELRQRRRASSAARRAGSPPIFSRSATMVGTASRLAEPAPERLDLLGDDVLRLLGLAAALVEVLGGDRAEVVDVVQVHVVDGR